MFHILEENMFIVNYVYAIFKEASINIEFDEAKTIQSPNERNLKLSEIFTKYLELGTSRGCEKAYEVVKYEAKEKICDRDQRDQLVIAIYDACFKIGTSFSLMAANTIREEEGFAPVSQSHFGELLMASHEKSNQK